MDVMQKQGTKISVDALVNLLQDYTKKKNLVKGRELCSYFVQNGLHLNTYVGNHLIHFFASCGSLLEAIQTFRALPRPDLYSWKAIISASAKYGQCDQAISLFQEMQQLKVRPNDHTFVAVLKACANIKALSQGRLIHFNILEAGYGSNMFVGSSLIGMYAKCGSIEEARKVFEQLPEKDVIAWSSMIEGYARHGLGRQALELFKEMQKESMQPDKVTFVSALKACTCIGSLDEGKLIHAQIVARGFELDLVVGSTLVHMYAKCGSLDKAHNLFTKMPRKNVVSWNALISGYGSNGLGQRALELFKQMKQECIKPDEATYVTILKVCGSLGALSDGMMIHSQIIKNQLDVSACLGSALVHMYAKCGSLDDAFKVFERLTKRDVVSWNAIIGAYVLHGLGNQALQLFERMQQAGNCLLDMYAKCGSLADAYGVFDEMPEKDVVSWSTMIAGYAQHGMSQQAFQLFNQMQKHGVKPNSVTFISMLKVCGNMAALPEGKIIHAEMIESGIEVDVQLGSALIDMYAKCGSLEMALSVFECLAEKNIVSWSSLIAGYAQHGLGLQALQIFNRMQQEGIKPDDATFVSVLSACSHASLLDEGISLFQSMSQKFGIFPKMRHYLCMVDLLGRTGNLIKAKSMIEQMPSQPDAVVWLSLLGACYTHGNVELGRHCFESVLKYDPKNSAAYVLMSNIYSSAGWLQEKT
ncbi:hypothetical protein O6H91_02G070400 [Diphasiastrum complanatum]|uniref:Uncharacterized protein n=1 Tax=Diphasiastrum complanatum TaxID=34168 RepID=A0ACC2EH19_DIPCM|nr:hypothetical protein O6H91_02G070400 [Diphasiastrum complanatum]